MKYVLLVFAFMMTGVVLAGGNNNTEIINNYYTTTTTLNNFGVSETQSAIEGVTMSYAASQHHFDLSTYSLQMSVGAASFRGEEALSFAIGKRVGDILINGSVSGSDNNQAYGFGATWRF